jgi:adenine-specific DNA-methyltransferase
MHLDRYYIEKIPIPGNAERAMAKIEQVVTKIISAKEDDPRANVSGLEAQVDKLVYALYELNVEEIAILEGGAI